MQFVKKIDNLFVLFITLLNRDIPTWVGWNSQRIRDDLPLQKIWYLPPINASPTNNAVVLHTLKIAQNVASQCAQKYISVTYDLQIAKTAMQIQCQESPKYDNIFIHLGAFHVQLSYFKAVGKFLEESGGPYILIEANVLAAGSLKGFITGTHFNRCKRIHGLLATAIQRLHLESYFEKYGIDSTALIPSLENVESLDNLPADIDDMLNNYETYYKDTENGLYGKTAKYWITYVSLIKIYQRFARSIRTGDFELYVSCLPKIASVMFAMNHHNYSRWLLRFYDNIVDIDSTHPGLKENLIAGGLSIRRTEKNFSRTPVDLTLEQTINADASGKAGGGIAALTNSISARKRWAVSHSLRTSLTTHLLDKLNLSNMEDITNETRPHIMEKNYTALSEIRNGIQNTLNPFDSRINKTKLFNLATGKAASGNTEDFLLNVLQIGEKARNDFLIECKNNNERFESPIKRQKVYTFASESKKLVKRDGKDTEVKLERDLMGRMLILALENNIDLELIMQYPLTSIPLSLGHIDGAINKTAKSALFKYLEKRTNHCHPTVVNCTLVDGFYFLHLIAANLPMTFGKLAGQILSKICQLKGNRIDIIFDKIISPSIKDLERESRGIFDRDVEYSITGPDQKRPTDLFKALRSDKFKSSLVEFLVQEWCQDHYATILGDKIIYVNCNDICYKYSNANGFMLQEIKEELICYHEEADSRIVFHLSKLPEDSNVVIKASDTDIFIIALGNFYVLPQNLSIWIETGTQRNNTLRYIHLNAIILSLGPELCNAMPAFHAITGCDYTAAFARKGKLKPFKILEQDKDMQAVFATFGNSENVDEKQIKAVEKFACLIYGKRQTTEINKARYEIFLDAYKPKHNDNEIFNRIRQFDGSSLPPCSDVLLMKIKRVNQVCGIWRHATQRSPKFYLPENHGWIIDNNLYTLRWYAGPQFPEKLEDILTKDINVLVDESDEDQDPKYRETSDEED
ncbi:uncharacterized protein LOC116169200 [Photinus pyralis]|uniref:uncharacterized protein LOC116169200 n=1 Tax=Photinus pyralis TaxID=7054 RepID=UPI001267817D|nr:uncharacterized protein LOC116169200 [Photinus pyralis]